MSVAVHPPHVDEAVGPPPPDAVRDHGDPPPPVQPDGDGDGGGDDLRVVAVFTQVWEAELARGALDEAGIPAVVDGSSMSNPYPSLAAVGWNSVRVLVRARYYEEARSVLADIAAD